MSKRNIMLIIFNDGYYLVKEIGPKYSFIGFELDIESQNYKEDIIKYVKSEIGLSINIECYFTNMNLRINEQIKKYYLYYCNVNKNKSSKHIHGSYKWIDMKKINRKYFSDEYIPTIKLLNSTDKYGWCGSIKEFLEMSCENFIFNLVSYVKKEKLLCSSQQISSWREIYYFLKEQINKNRKVNKDIRIVFEYKLPLEGGRRPDIIIFYSSKIIVIEAKHKSTVDYRDINQLKGYLKDLKNYHVITNEKKINIEGYILLTKQNTGKNELSGIKVLDKLNFEHYIDLKGKEMNINNVKSWLKSSYEPIPSILNSVSDIFNYGKLTQVKAVERTDINKTINSLKKIIHETEMSKESSIVFLSGAPGAGKTLAGLYCLFDYNKFIYNSKGITNGALYVSLNKYLANALVNAINDESYDFSGKSYIKAAEDVIRSRCEINFPVIILDEVQRVSANDENIKFFAELNRKNKYRNGYSVLICIIGIRQSVGKGEENGIENWVNYFQTRSNWNIYCSKEFEYKFKTVSKSNKVKILSELNMKVSVRNNFISVAELVESILFASQKQSKILLDKINNEGFTLRITRDLDDAKKYLQSIRDCEMCRVGLLVSSNYKNDNNKENFADNWNTAVKWINEECNNLKTFGTEETCQGLELDYSIVYFCGDYKINHNVWECERKINKKKEELSLNNYCIEKFRVKSIYNTLLTRARKGMILVIDEDVKMDSTYRFLSDIGVYEI